MQGPARSVSGLSLLTAVAIGAVGFCHPAGAQQVKPFKDTLAPPPGKGIEALRPAGLDDPTNAALCHYRVWTMTSATALAEFDALWGAESELKADWKPSAALRRVLSTLGDYADGAIRASRIPVADWGVEYSDGFMALLPHLTLVRREAKVLELRARVAMVDATTTGRADAIECIAACFRLSHHVANDRTVISTLVAGAIANRAATLVAFLIDEGKITRADAPVILEAVGSLPKDDPFGLSGALRGELWLGVTAFAKTGADAGKQASKVARELVTMGDGKDDSRKELFVQLEAMDEGALRADVLKHQAYFDQAQKALRSADADAAIQALNARVGAGEFGVTLQFTAPSVLKGIQGDRKNRDGLREVASKLEALK